MQTAGGVKQHHIKALELCGLQRASCDIDRLLPLDNRQGRHIGLPAKHSQLFLRGGAMDIKRGHHHFLAAPFGQSPLAQSPGNLGRGCGLARTLQADHHNDRRRWAIDMERHRLRPEHGNQAVIDDFDDLLTRRHRFKHLLPDGRFRHTGNKVPRDGQCNIGLKQGNPNFAHRTADIAFAERTAASEPAEYATKAVAETFKHRSSDPCLYRACTAHRRAKHCQPADAMGAALCFPILQRNRIPQRNCQTPGYRPMAQ